MICLFNKIFLTYAESSVDPINSHIIPSNYVQLIDRGLVDIQNQFFQKYRLHYAKNLRDLFNETSFDDFINSLQSAEGNVFIYADEESFIEFFIRWFKGIFQNISYQTLFLLYKNFGDYQQLLPNKKNVYLDINNDSSKIKIDSILPNYWNFSKEQFEGLFHLYEPFNISMDIKLKVSTEVQLLQHIVAENSMLTPIAIMNFSNLYKKRFMEEVTGLIRTCLRKIYLNKNNTLENTLFFENDTNIKMSLLSNPELSFLLDTNINETVEGFTYFFGLANKEKHLEQLVKIDESLSLEADNPCINYYLEKKSHPLAIDLINLEIKQSGPFEILKHYVQNNELNIFLVQAISQLKQRNSAAIELRELEMEFGI
jgi:hypothetical protein